MYLVTFKAFRQWKLIEMSDQADITTQPINILLPGPASRFGIFDVVSTTRLAEHSVGNVKPTGVEMGGIGRNGSAL
jgi:hypothetical protein